MEEMNQKATVTQDFLYEYLLGHDVNLSRLNELMGISNGTLMGCFRHNPDRHGKPMSFSADNVERLNGVLWRLAALMRQSVITFGSEQTYTNKRGTTYDPGAMPQIRALSRYFKLNTFCRRVLGWNLNKKEAILCAPSSNSYGCVCADDVARINAEILAVAGMLSGIEVVMTDANLVK